VGLPPKMEAAVAGSPVRLAVKRRSFEDLEVESWIGRGEEQARAELILGR
jgi:hypothetical protein